MHELDEVAPHVETIALRGERSLRGMLDPLRVAPSTSVMTLLSRSFASYFRLVLKRRGRQRLLRLSTVCYVMPARQRATRSCACSRPATLSIRRSPRRLRCTPELVDAARVCRPRRSATRCWYASGHICADPGSSRLTAGPSTLGVFAAERVGEQVVRLIAMFAMQLMSAERSRLKCSRSTRAGDFWAIPSEGCCLRRSSGWAAVSSRYQSSAPSWCRTPSLTDGRSSRT